MLNETGMYYSNHDALKKQKNKIGKICTEATASVRLNVATALA